MDDADPRALVATTRRVVRTILRRRGIPLHHVEEYTQRALLAWVERDGARYDPQRGTLRAFVARRAAWLITDGARDLRRQWEREAEIVDNVTDDDPRADRQITGPDSIDDLLDRARREAACAEVAAIFRECAKTERERAVVAGRKGTDLAAAYGCSPAQISRDRARVLARARDALESMGLAA